ncbi:hypothetical protein MMC28_010596 [Mycoblastus sanguinarius]|nr:hypothetical protein [Mycoblastus sanguinarius]
MTRRLGPETWLGKIIVAGSILLCIPCFYAMVALEDLNTKRQYKATVPKPLPRKRRALSLSKGSAPVSEIGLLSRLPYEIRQMVYVNVLGNKIIHLIHIAAKRRVGHVDYKLFDMPEYYANPGLNGLPNGKLALVKTCRQVYVEAIDILYKTNTFGIFNCNNLATYTYFSQTIRPERLASITSMYIINQGNSFYFKGPNWTLLWEDIATKMPGLKDVKVRITDAEPQLLSLDLDEDWVKAMLPVRGLKKFRFDVEEGSRGPFFAPPFRDRIQSPKTHLESKLCEPT